MTLSRILIATALATLIASPVLAQTSAPAPATPAKPAAAAPMTPAAAPAAKPSKAERSAKSLECSKEADAKKLHGKARKKFRESCIKGA